MKKETKKIIIKLIFILIILFFIGINFFNNVFAGNTFHGIGPNPNPDEEKTKPVFIIVKKVLIAFQGIAGLIAIIMIIYLGIEYFTKSHNPEERAKLNNRIYSILLGIVLVGGAIAILEIVKSIIDKSVHKLGY